MTRYKLLGVNVDIIPEEDIYNKIIELSKMEKPTYIILLDTFLLMKTRFSKELQNIINQADYVLPISPGIKFGLNFLKRKTDYIYNYFNFTIRLLTFLTEEKKNVYILGGNKNNSELIEKNIRDSFPGIRLMGKYWVDYKKDFESKLITAMQKVDPALVLVSMRRPKQEKWIYTRKKHFQSGVFLGVDNFINILVGKHESPKDNKLQSGSYSIHKIIRNPFRIFYYIFYFMLLLVYKIFRLD